MKTTIAILVCGVALAACRSNRSNSASHDSYDDQASASHYGNSKQYNPQHPYGNKATSDDSGHVREASAPYPPTDDFTKSNNEGAKDTKDSFGRMASEDLEFAAKAAEGGLFEVESSRLALQKNVSNGCREFAQMMVDDHGKGNQKLQDLVAKKGGTLSSELSRACQNELEELRKLEGREFERRYHDAQVKAHDDAIKAFEDAARNCRDEELRHFASDTLPTLREHRRRLDDLGF